MISSAEISVLRERLLALSDKALKELMKKEGLEVPPGVAKILLVDLLLEVFEEKFANQDSQNNNFVRLASLKFGLPYGEKETEGSEETFPGYYNDTRIVLLLRDPFWAYAYWDIKGGTLKSIKKEHETDNVVLRVTQLKGGESSKMTVMDSYDIPIGVTDGSRYIHIPQQGVSYSVSLVLQGKTWEKPLITSNIVKVPDLPLMDNLPEIITLSEIDKLDIAQPDEQTAPGPQKTIPQRISSPETAQFLEPDT